MAEKVLHPDLIINVRYDAQGRRLCKALRRHTGEPCSSPAMRGQDVCRMHGGGAPQNRRKAKLRLLELVDPAIATLAREMTQADTSADRRHAAIAILDRAGFGRETRITGGDARELLVKRLLELRDGAPGSLSADPYYEPDDDDDEQEDGE